MKQYCKECLILKELTEFYQHPQGKNGVLARCKDCIKKGRKTEREREMARNRDNRYYASQLKTRERIRLHSIRWREENPLKRQAHIIVSNYLKKSNALKFSECSHCGGSHKIHLHHEDYSKPKEVIPLCQRCHLSYHAGTIMIDISKKVSLG